MLLLWFDASKFFLILRWIVVIFLVDVYFPVWFINFLCVLGHFSMAAQKLRSATQFSNRKHATSHIISVAASHRTVKSRPSNCFVN
jgi:hypothetical protein